MKIRKNNQVCYEIDKNHPFCRVTCTLFLVRWSAFLPGKPPCSPCRRPVSASGHHPWAETSPRSSWPPPKSDPKQQIWSLNHSLCFFVTDNNHYGWPCFTVVYEATEVSNVGKRQDFPNKLMLARPGLEPSPPWPRPFPLGCWANQGPTEFWPRYSPSSSSSLTRCPSSSRPRR